MLKITVPKPCHQDWDGMTAETQGRHCAVCAKTVIDFTGMSDAAVQNFLLQRQQEKVCGRFRNEQLQNSTIHLPENIFTQPLPLWKHFLAACLLVYGMMLFSCNTTTKGEPVVDVKEVTLPKDIDLTTGVKEMPAPPPSCTVGTLGYTVITDSYTTGDVVLAPPLPQVMPADNDTANKNITAADSVRVMNADPGKIKNPPETDSVNCNTTIFY